MQYAPSHVKDPNETFTLVADVNKFSEGYLGKK